jgi:hypothetical protein
MHGEGAKKHVSSMQTEEVGIPVRNSKEDVRRKGKIG